MPLPCAEIHRYPGKDCRLCWWVAQPGEVGAKYRLAWGIPESAVGTSSRACVHLGEVNGELTPCRECARRGSMAKVFTCEVHTRCTTEKQSTNTEMACCRTCPDYRPPITTSTGVQLVVSADGIGDHILALAAATAWKRDNPGRQLTFVCKIHKEPWVRLFDAYDELSVGEHPTTPKICDLSSRGSQHYIEAVQSCPMCS